MLLDFHLADFAFDDRLLQHFQRQLLRQRLAFGIDGFHGRLERFAGNKHRAHGAKPPAKSRSWRGKSSASSSRFRSASVTTSGSTCVSRNSRVGSLNFTSPLSSVVAVYTRPPAS